jgi:Kef-type K+ transport system membrane component KefB
MNDASPSAESMNPVVVIRLILAALVGQTIVVACIFTTMAPIKPTGPAPDSPILSYVLSGIALAMIPFAGIAMLLITRNQNARPANSDLDRRSRFIARRLVPAAILEAGALKSLVAFLLEAQTFSLIVGAILAGFIVTLWPTSTSFESQSASPNIDST